MDVDFLLAKVGGTLGGLAFIILVGLLLEQLVPAEQEQPFRVLLFKIRILVIFTIIGVFLGYETSLLIGKALSGIEGGSGLTLGISLEPRIVRLLAALLVFDFFYYWLHRLQHQSSFLWQQHKLHHADPALNVISASFHHWLEGPLRTVFISIPMIFVLKLSVADLGVLGTVLSVWAALKHANVRIPLGPLTPIIVGPQLHRLHHSVKAEHHDRNYAAFFPIYDLVFGTYCRPARDEWPPTGLPSGQWPSSVAEANLWPFRAWWDRMRSRTVQARSRPARSDAPPS
jgi:sterol desaturase/sphingolipid hydroxylase (fatty acid hydroxylase superfamily)